MMFLHKKEEEEEEEEEEKCALRNGLVYEFDLITPMKAGISYVVWKVELFLFFCKIGEWSNNLPIK